MSREYFPVIETSDGEGASLLSRQDGVTSAATGNHMGVLAYKDSSGNDVKPQLSASGQVPVTFAAGTPSSASANVTIAALNTEEDVVALPLANNDVVEASMAMGSSFMATEFKLYHDDNGVLTKLAEFIVGAGDFSHVANLDNISFTCGATGTQRMVLRATQLRGKLTEAYGSISLSVAP
jgi:hypothetical protein